MRTPQMLRREFLTSTASGLGALALGSMLKDDGLLAADAGSANPLVVRESHFPAAAKNCIFIFLAGAPSQIDLHDPKPKLVELHGQPIPESYAKGTRFAFISTETARLKGSPRVFRKHG